MHQINYKLQYNTDLNPFLLDISDFPSFGSDDKLDPPTLVDESGGLLGLAPPVDPEVAWEGCETGCEPCPDIFVTLRNTLY